MLLPIYQFTPSPWTTSKTPHLLNRTKSSTPHAPKLIALLLHELDTSFNTPSDNVTAPPSPRKRYLFFATKPSHRSFFDFEDLAL
jgi:hypothetical protein